MKISKWCERRGVWRAYASSRVTRAGRSAVSRVAAATRLAMRFPAPSQFAASRRKTLLGETPNIESSILGRNLGVSDESARRILRVRLGNCEIEHAHAEHFFPPVGAPIACADHETQPVGLRRSKINHRMRHRRVRIHNVCAGPEKKVARKKSIELKTVLAIADDRMKSIRLAGPHVLLAGRSRDIRVALLQQQKIDSPRAVHSTLSRLSRAVKVIKIALRELQGVPEELLHFQRVLVEVPNVFGFE